MIRSFQRCMVCGAVHSFESRPKKRKITAKIGKKISWAIKLYNGPIFENLIQNSKILLSVHAQCMHCSVNPYIKNTNIKKKFSKKNCRGFYHCVALIVFGNNNICSFLDGKTKLSSSICVAILHTPI
jgi:hypothetical protein